MATSKTLAPTNVTISIPAMTDAPDASVFSNCVDKEADAINALNSQIAQGMRSIEKSTTATAATLKFTFTGDRYSALVFKTDNQGGSSGIYAITYKKTYGHSVEKIVGSSTMPTIDGDGSINVDVHSWSKVTVLTDMLAEFS